MPNTTNNYLIPLAPAEFKITIKGSKFLGHCEPVSDEAAAMEFIKQRSRQFHSATHNCWAYRVGDSSQPTERSSDEGEPSGTAGRPILEQLAKLNLIGAALIVSRWFGGTKLGRGGLIRAYGGCAAETLELLKTEIRQPMTAITVECGYDLVGFIERTTLKCKGYVEDREFAEFVRLTVKLPAETGELFQRILSDDGGGKVSVVNVKPDCF